MKKLYFEVEENNLQQKRPPSDTYHFAFIHKGGCLQLPLQTVALALKQSEWFL